MKDAGRQIAAKPVEERSSSLVRQVVLLFLLLACPVRAERLTLSPEARPDWLQRDGIVMAGSWEPLLFRVRRDGYDGYTPTAEQRAAYLQEHSPEMVAQLKDLGVNFVMMHCYKGAGLAAERESMLDAVRFAELCRDAGLRVGVYNYSGAFLWEPLLKEVPQAEDWVLLDERGKPLTYGSATYRYYWNRNHPDAQAFYRKVVSFAVNEIRADLLHFDNYIAGPGRDTNSIQRFRQYLRDTFTIAQLEQMGAADPDTELPPVTGLPGSLLGRAWLDFCCRSLADSYHDMSRYARTLRRDVLIECNPGGPGDRIRPPVDHGRLLQGGEAFWDEGRQPGYRDGQLYTRIRTYKIARRADNMAFTYTTTPLEMAESMAFNLDCLGCICWFEYGRIVAQPGSNNPVSDTLAPFVEFFHRRRDLLRSARLIADVAVLRSFPSQVFADSKQANLTYRVEQTLIDNRICFQIIYDQQLDDLKRYSLLILAGCVAMSDKQVEQIERYVRAGGKVCIVGPAGTHNEWMLPRGKSAFDDLPESQVLRLAEDGDIIAAIRQICDDELSLFVQAGAGLCAQLTEQAGRRLLHLVNYRANDPIQNIAVSIRLPAGCQTKTVMLAGPQRDGDIELPFEVRDHLVQFTVPEVNRYEIAVLTIK
jgi:hypothetical protein